EIHVPPLRERHDEIPQLIEFFTAKYAKRYNRREPALSPTLLDALASYAWPGNVRELENVIKRYVILQDETLLLRELQQTSVRRAYASASSSVAVLDRPPVTAAPPPPARDAGDSGDDEDDAAAPTAAGEGGVSQLPADGPQ